MTDLENMSDNTVADKHNDIHQAATERLLAWAKSDGCSPGEMQCILRYLKDNDVSSFPIPGSAHAELRESLPFPVKEA